MAFLRLIVLGFALVLAGAHPLAAAAGGEPQALAASPLVIESGDERYEFSVEVAETPEQQRTGLMFRSELGAREGMLFVHPRPRIINMWMKNTLIPLDMIFIGEGGRIIRIAENTAPHSLATVSSLAPAIAVLEVNAGTAAGLGLEVGDTVRHAALGNPGPEGERR